MPPVRERWIREVKRETKGIAKGRNSTVHLASSSAALFTGRYQCPGTHCSLIEKEEREDSSCQVRNSWKERPSRLVVGTAKTSEELAESCRLQHKNLSKLGLPKTKGCLSATK